MNLQLVHTLDERVEARYRDMPLFEYVHKSRTAPMESPRPYLHPVYTLGGNLVTIFRPHDHVWHRGITMTSAHVSTSDHPAENFWGGPTYVRDQGYVQLDNNGRMEHQSWNTLQCDGERAVLDEALQWITHDGQPWLAERREITLSEVNPTSGYWQLDFHFRLTNIASRPLTFGSPTTAGRPLAGYGGLFWRGPRSFTGGRILAAGGLEGPDVMGKAAAWLAYIGKHDGNAQTSTLLFVDDPANPRYPTRWFVRNDPYACASFAFSFDEEYALEAGAELALRHHILIADGEWSRERIEVARPLDSLPA
jgi:hypothetical protein